MDRYDEEAEQRAGAVAEVAARLRNRGIMVAVVFLDSGWNHLKNPAERSKSIGASTGFTVFLGVAEVLGSLGVAFGVLTQLAAIGLILLMLGAIQKKIFVWKIGFWGGRAYGWHYDLMLLVMNLVILVTGGGRLSLMPAGSG